MLVERILLKSGFPQFIETLENELGIRMVYNVGGEKVQSSSELIKKSEIFSKK